uniref:CRAL-TRIO domain-containing protein n=1 Tax=Acrobeloides nanus TaxID=290746 RepID=A0A914DLH4_9BILA
MQERAAPEAFSPAEIKGARVIREKLVHLLPPEFNTEFFLARWWRAYKGDVKMIEQRLTELINHRNAFGYNSENVLDKALTLDFARKTLERFTISRFHMEVFSDDVAVFVHKMEGCNLKEILKVLPLSNILHSYFVLHECFQRTMHKHELRTGRPAAIVTILDLSGLNLSDFMNPMSACSKLARLVVKIWSDYFSENMIRLYLLHPPGFLSLMWQIAKHIVDAKTQSQIVFIEKLEDLHKFLTPNSIPIEYGGTRRDDTGFSTIPESCVRELKPVLESEYFKPENFWREHGFRDVPDMKSVSLKSKHVYEISKDVKAGQKILWQFVVNSDFTFEITRVGPDGKEHPIWPKITLTSLKVPEHGFVHCDLQGEYRIRWVNASHSWLPSKLTYAATTK